MTERLHFHFSLSCIGEGNGSPLQYSCLENPRDGEAWLASIYGMAQSRTRLKRLSSSSSSPSRTLIFLVDFKLSAWLVKRAESHFCTFLAWPTKKTTLNYLLQTEHFKCFIPFHLLHFWGVPRGEVTCPSLRSRARISTPMDPTSKFLTLSEPQSPHLFKRHHYNNTCLSAE